MAFLCKKPRLAEEPTKLDAFSQWMQNRNFIISDKVFISKQGISHNYGMLASADIERGEILFEIPRAAVLNPHSCSISDILEQDADLLQCRSGWTPLLLALMYEIQNPNSDWKPYLDLVFGNDKQDHPMFWEREMMLCELNGTGIPEKVTTDLNNMKCEFETIVEPFIQIHPDKFTTEECNFDLYKKIVAFVMAYSFTESNSETDSDDNDESNDGVTHSRGPMMVPLADILNHVAENNAELEFGATFKMRCVKPIKKGEEVYNTYGYLSNAELLHMHGFALGANCHDTIDIPVKSCLDQYEELHPADKLFIRKLLHIEKIVSPTEDIFIFGHEGFLSKEIIETLTLLHHDSTDFKSCLKNSGTKTGIFATAEVIAEFPASWKLLLSKCCEKHLQLLLQDTCTVSTDDATRRRVEWSKLVREGQATLLLKLQAFCSSCS